jgi:predicted transposase YdaD
MSLPWELKALLPLATVMKGGANETTLRRAAVRIQQEERSEDLQRLLGIFSSYVLGGNIVDKILNFATQALLESPWGQEILQQGVEEGRQEGRQEGREEGKEQEARRLIQRMIQRRFGEVSEAVEANLQRLNREQLETIADTLIDVNSLEELMAAFPPVTDN